MNVPDILRKHPAMRVGYEPVSISLTSFDPTDCLIKLSRIPSKISAYFHREKISEVWKTTYPPQSIYDYYILVATDGTKFHVEY